MPKAPEKHHRKSSSRSSLKDKDSGSIADNAAKQDKEKVCTSPSRKRGHHEKRPIVVKNRPNDDENFRERLCYLSPGRLEFDKTGLPFKYYENEKAECGGGADIEEFARLWKDYKKSGEVSEVAASMPTRGGRKDAAMGKEEGLESEGLSISQVLEKMRHILETKGHLGLNEFEKLLKKTEEEPVLHRLEMFEDGNNLPPYAGQGVRCVTSPKEVKRKEAIVNKEVQQQLRTEYDDYIAMNNGEPLTHYSVPLQRRSVAGEVSLGHTVVNLHEAFNLRITRLQALVSTYLMPNRERLLQIRKRFLSDSEEIKITKAGIERETIADMEAILERLRSAETLKQATLSQRLAEVTVELEALNNVVRKVSGVASLRDLYANRTATSPHVAILPAEGYAREFEDTAYMVDLIQSYGEICTMIERVKDKPFIVDANTPSDNFPRETAERMKVLECADRYEKALAVKDQMVWNLMTEVRQLEEKAEAETILGREYENELEKWANLANRLAEENAVLLKEKADSSVQHPIH